MNAPARILGEKRLYNKWVASETLEDYALRYTADRGRRWSVGRVAGTAIGATAFLACEAIGASLTLSYGFANTVGAILAATVIMFVFGFPIAYAAAKEGLDIDLLTRGAGFGYLGSTITSLIYASFTFLLFAVEASIMSLALTALTGMPLAISYVVSALLVIPIALYGMSAITRFQAWTQPIWIVLQLLPIAYLAWAGGPVLDVWRVYEGEIAAGAGGMTLIMFGFALSTLLSLLPQIGEQADYLRFLPSREKTSGGRWWSALILAGPGWAIIGAVKLLLGSCLAVFAISRGLVSADATDPTNMFLALFRELFGNPTFALLLTGLFVIVCQLKINVTNAYAGSIAWSNFFARLTHSHPGRVVWLVFNVLVALLLMQLGIFGMIHSVLILYANLAAGWMGALAADLMISKPLGLSPKGIEFKRAHLYDVNPVGIGAMTLSIIVSGAALAGLLGSVAHALAPVIGLAIAFVAAPAIALLTHSRYYIARTSHTAARGEAATCVICENEFQQQDMAGCPLYAAPICSLCCTLESRCHDMCKEDSRIEEQAARVTSVVLPKGAARYVQSSIGSFAFLFSFFCLLSAGVLYLVYREFAADLPPGRVGLRQVLLTVFFAFAFLAGIAAWLVVLARNSRRAAERELSQHVELLSQEIAAHDETDAQLQKAKQAAETANQAKSRYLVSVSHEIRSPLNSIYGYAQLLERGTGISPAEAGQVIRRSSEHLTNMVDGLLDISRVESGVLRLSREPIRLPNLLEEVMDMFRPQAVEKGIDFSLQMPPDLPIWVYADRKRLRQILINLVSNAVKFTDAGSVRIETSYRSEVATFRVIDTGIGISHSDLRRIFEPFDRGTNPAAYRHSGVGLGLAITRALINILGGELLIDSQPGRGSCFTVKLMLSRLAGAPPEAVADRVRSGYRGPRRRILIVDDSKAQLRVLSSFLEPLGFDVRTEASGEDALEAARGFSPDLALLDISLPGISGWDVAHELRRQRGENIKIAMISANAHEVQTERADVGPHDLFLPKPADLLMVLDAIDKLLAPDWTGATEPTGDGPLEPAQDCPPAPWSAVEAYLEEVVSLCGIGHLRGIEARLAQMTEAVPASRSLALKLQPYLERFDFAGLAKEVERSRAHV